MTYSRSGASLGGAGALLEVVGSRRAAGRALHRRGSTVLLEGQGLVWGSTAALGGHQFVVRSIELTAAVTQTRHSADHGQEQRAG